MIDNFSVGHEIFNWSIINSTFPLNIEGNCSSLQNLIISRYWSEIIIAETTGYVESLQVPLGLASC